jgi:hypothetical protein
VLRAPRRPRRPRGSRCTAGRARSCAGHGGVRRVSNNADRKGGHVSPARDGPDLRVGPRAVPARGRAEAAHRCVGLGRQADDTRRCSSRCAGCASALGAGRPRRAGAEHVSRARSAAPAGEGQTLLLDSVFRALGLRPGIPGRRSESAATHGPLSA